MKISCGGLLIFSVWMFTAATTRAQPPDTLWIHDLGGARADFGYSIAGTSDSGFIIAGITASAGAGNADVWLIKLDEAGSVMWTRTFGGAADEEGRYACQTADGGYIITGMTESYAASGSDLWLIKTDSLGNLEWNGAYGDGGEALGSFVQPTPDGGYIVVGRTTLFDGADFDILLLKTDSAGQKQWSAVYGGDDDDFGYTVRVTPAGDYILAGYTESYGNGNTDLCLIKADALGEEEWLRTFGGGGADYGGYLLPTPDGGYVIGGETHSFGSGNGDLWLVKTDERGNEEWQSTSGGINLDGGYAVVQRPDGGYLVAGWTESFGLSSRDVYLVKFTAVGNREWDRNFGNGDLLRGLGCVAGSDDDSFITGYMRHASDDDYDALLLHLTSLDIASTAADPAAAPAMFSLFDPYPNPFNSQTTIRFCLPHPGEITLQLFDLLGRPVRLLTEGYYESGFHSLHFDADELSSGVYFVRLQNARRMQTIRCLLLR